MESLEFNKIAAGILVALLLVVGIGKVGNLLYAPELPEHAAVETEGDAHSDADVGGGDHGDMSADLPLPVLLANANLDDGQKLFNRCKSCHTADNGGKNGVGPNLWGIVGAPKEHLSDFDYSGALGTVGGDWTFEDLDAFIANPKGFAPGTKMTFAGIPDAEDRATLIAWLNAQSDHPLPLPEVEMMPVEETGSHDEAADSMTDEIVEAVESASDDVASAADAVADEVSDAADDMTEVLESNTDVADNADAGLADDANTPSGVEAMVAAASVDDGQGVAKKCQSCHTFDEGGANRVGPNLWNVVNRPIGSVADYSYSDAMAEAGGTWTYDRLWTYIQDPKTDMPGNKMGFRGISDEADLAALIAYLRSLSNDPAPLAGAP